MARVIVVGAGIFGLGAAHGLAARGHAVTLLDPGPLPHPLAASTDVSKVVRSDYGDDAGYVELMQTALEGWAAWNAAWEHPPFVADGFLMLRRTPMVPGGFEHDSFHLLASRGVPVRRLDAADLRREHPELHVDWVEGYLNPTAGWVWSSAVVAGLVERLAPAGITHVPLGAARLTDDRGVVTTAGDVLRGDLVVVAAGAWSARLLPELDALLRVTSHPVVHLRPERPARFTPPGFRPWAAEIAETGWYGLPLHPTGIVKVARHGAGTALDPDTEDRSVDDATVEELRAFLAGTWPALADAPVAATRRCCYTDTLDGDFLVARVPCRDGVVVATGGSGHGFKFAPVLGDLVADVVEDRASPWRARFGWRDGSVAGATEAARAGA